MSLINKFIAGGISLGMAFGAATLSCAEEAPVDNQEPVTEETSKPDAILFRIENIKPVENENGLTEKCTFILTVYNRTQKEVEEAEIDLFWRDEISAKYKIENDEVMAVSKEAATTVIHKNMLLEKIFPHEQKSFEGEVETDKCFLLLDQVEYKVNTCIAAGDNIPVKDNKRLGVGSCTGSFDYINSKNPEYYSEFKDVPESVLEKQAEENKARELSGIENAYDAAEEGLENITAELDRIIKGSSKVEAEEEEEAEVEAEVEAESEDEENNAEETEEKAADSEAKDAEAAKDDKNAE